jgi:hypothetical protein
MSCKLRRLIHRWWTVRCSDLSALAECRLGGFGALGEEGGGYILEVRKGGHFDCWSVDGEQCRGL